MNLPKSSRYHRARRRADGVAYAAVTAVLLLLMLTPAGVGLRAAVGGSAGLYALALLACLGVVRFPVAWYRDYRLERQYALSQPSPRDWLAGRLKIEALTLAVAVPMAAFVYWSMRWPEVWWLAAAAGCAMATSALTAVGPVLVLPLLHTPRPLGRPPLRSRLERLSSRAGVPILSVHELPLGDRSRRASATLVGSGSTRRILLSDTLLSNYSDDEIEVVMAHEMGHHVHRHLLKASLVDGLLLLVGFRAAAAALDEWWGWLGMSSPADVAGMPLLVLALGAVMMAATPLLNWWSRSQERLADRFALEHASEPAAFIGAVRRMSAQNLAEDHPSSATVLFFQSHPTPEERIASARELLADVGRTPSSKSQIPTTPS